MTKEETISNLKAYLNGDTAIDNIIPLRSILKSVLKYLEPYLPSNLDEAAEDASIKKFPDEIDLDGDMDAEIWYKQHVKYWRVGFKDGFKAGAEWMAGQGVEAKVLQAFTDGSAYIECPYDGRSGDKVIVQIRKK